VEKVLKVLLIMAKLKSVLKSVFWGLLFLAGGFQLWLSIFGNPIHELALIKRGVVTDGVITDTWEDTAEADDGTTIFFHGITYTFQLPDGRTVTGYRGNRQGRLHNTTPHPFEVRYLPDNPAVSWIKADVSPTIGDWLLLKVVGGGLALVLLLSPGVGIIYSEFYPQLEN
jgi:uncharacterized protein DUF3592